MWPEHRDYTDDTKAEALGEIRKFTANMEGTELYDCLGHVLKNTGAPSEQPKGKHPLKWLSDRLLPSTTNSQTSASSPQAPAEPEHIVILMTDGQVSGSVDINKMINSTPNTRLCALGIGNDANRNQLVELANSGHGFCYMASDSKDITALIANMIANCCMYKYFTNIRINHKHVAEFGYPNTINTMYYKRSTLDEELLLTYEDSELPGVTLSNTIDVSVVPGDNTITQLYYANMEPDNEAAHLEHTILNKHNSFFLKSVEKITATGPLTQETIAHHSSCVDGSNFTIAKENIDFLIPQCTSVRKSRTKHNAYTSTQSVVDIMRENIDSVLQRGEQLNSVDSDIDDLRFTIQTLNHMRTPIGSVLHEQCSTLADIGVELEEQCEMIDDIDVEKAEFQVRAAQGYQPSAFGTRIASSFKSMLGMSSTPSKMSNASSQVSALTSLTKPQSNPARTPDMAPVEQPNDIMSYRLTNGSFRYSEKLLNIIGYTLTEFQTYIVRNNLSEEMGVNQLVIEYLINTNDSKYALVIVGIRQYLQKLKN
jgi:hypothetical protein